MAGLLESATTALGGINPITAGLSVAGSIFGMVKSAKAKKANQALLDKQQAENKAIYDNNANKSFLDTNVAKDAVKQANSNLVDDRKAVAGRQAVTGGSDESAVAQNTRVSKSYGDRLSQIAGMGTAYQQNQEAMYRGTKSNLDNAQMGLNQDDKNSAGNLAENAGGLMQTATFGVGGKKKYNAPGISDAGQD